MSEIIAPLTNPTTTQKPKFHKKLFNTPNTIDLWHGKDSKENSKPYVGGNGRDPFTHHIVQTELPKSDVKYIWNSLGLRGPEIDYTASTKIIFGGGSLLLGTGINVEDSFPYIVAKKLNASYLNISPADTLTDLVDPLTEYKKFKPDYIIWMDTINKSRFQSMNRIFTRPKKYNLRLTKKTLKFNLKKTRIKLMNFFKK